MDFFCRSFSGNSLFHQENVRISGSESARIPTATAIPKEKMVACMEAINRAVAPVPVTIGDVVIENVADTGVAVVAAANLEI